MKNKDMNKKAKFNQTPEGTLQKSHDKSWFTQKTMAVIDDEDLVVLQIMGGVPVAWLEVVRKEDFEGIKHEETQSKKVNILE